MIACAFRFLVGFLAIAFAILPAGATDLRTIPSLDDFLSEPDVMGPELSPSGRYVSFVRPLKGETESHVVVINDLDDPSAEPIQIGFGIYKVEWVEWVTDDRLLVSLSGLINFLTGEKVSSFGGWDGPVFPIKYSRIMAMDRDGQNNVVMFRDSEKIQRGFWLSGVTSFLPHDPEHIIMPAYVGNELDLFKVNVNDGSSERIGVGTLNTTAWYVDRDGEPAFRYNSNQRRTVLRIYAREDRENGKIRWKKIKTLRLDSDNETREAATEFRPISPGPEVSNYYVAARPENENTTGIYLYDFEKDVFLEKIYSREDVDVESALFDRETRAYLGAFFFVDRLQLDLVDRSVQKHLDALNTYFGDQANVIPIDTSRNGQRWLVEALGPTEPGTIHIYDVEKAFAQGIATVRPALLGKKLSPTIVVEYKARDGLALRGYLTRPSGATKGEFPPLIVLPHGGPEVRDYVEFTIQVQYLASLGYQVFQPNFRGSSGFGKKFADLGRREFGKAMQTDVEDGFHHLVAEGYAQSDRACIMGYSYGGYVALAAATLTPELYKCVIAGAGISDLVKQLKWDRKEEGAKSEAYEYWVKQIGDPKEDQTTLQEVSPALLADRVKAPILLIHGEKDKVVPIEQSEFMQAALNDAKKPGDFLRLEDSGHSSRSDEDMRLEYEKISTFLATHLPAGRPRPTSETAKATDEGASSTEQSPN